ncbi:hypothetical protein CIB95_04750 [Lottiidibacillus patelloidae]|uniref:HAD family hydrolase n=1 Tax=Lottiidibacillus patelloidae TaxID=2670334 RepID=A0A263BVA3_9BACI|nr:HAD family hydrolase [Lottiidibacillus patelloidae]OZM57683.1 hypothetical protein CIB95_04750 [Lottiidibacillus patelloidae]
MTKLNWNIIFFDLDNTLYSHEDAFQAAIINCYETISLKKLKKYGITNPVSSKIWFKIFKVNCDKYWADYEEGILTRRKYQHKRYIKTMAEFAYPFTVEDADEFHSHYESIVHTFAKPYKGVKSLLKRLTERGIIIGIITNGKQRIQLNKLIHLELLQFFPTEHIIISEGVGSEKPSKHIFDFVRLKWNYKQNKHLYIGDSWDQDIVGAMEAGWEAIFLNSRNEKSTTNHKPIFVAESFQDIYTFFNDV